MNPLSLTLTLHPSLSAADIGRLAHSIVEISQAALECGAVPLSLNAVAQYLRREYAHGPVEASGNAWSVYHIGDEINLVRGRGTRGPIVLTVKRGEA